MNRSWPKLLVVTEFSPNALGGGPSVVRQMLKGWPTERLLWWSCLPDPEPNEFKVNAHLTATIPRKLYPHSRLVRPKVWLLDHFWSKWATSHLKVAIKQHQPDVVWVIPHQWSILPLAAALPTTKQHYHISVHDYPVHHAEGKVGLRMTMRLASLLDDLYRQAASRDVICQQMASDLQHRTGRGADEILNAGVEPEDFVYLEGKRSINRNTIKIAHAGTITAEADFTRFVESLARVRNRLQAAIELHFFGAHSYRGRPWFAADWMIEHGNVSDETFRAELRNCDWGLSPMELTNENPRYNRFSLPSKTVRYLAAGLPIITVGHKDSTIVQLARRYSFGVTIQSVDSKRMDELLLEAFREENVWRHYRDEILRCARKEFDAVQMRTRLHSALGRKS
jgi:hypothetical protein